MRNENTNIKHPDRSLYHPGPPRDPTRPIERGLGSHPAHPARTFHTLGPARGARASRETVRETAYPTPHVPPLPPGPCGARIRPRPDRLHPERRLAHAPGDLRALVRRVDRGRDRADWARVRGLEAAADLIVQVEGAGGTPHGAGHRLPRPVRAEATQTWLPTRTQDVRAGSRVAQQQPRQAGHFQAVRCR